MRIALALAATALALPAVAAPADDVGRLAQPDCDFPA